MEVVSDLSDGMSGRINYMSASFFEFHHILCKTENAVQHPVFGHLTLPQNPANEPVPCIIACHGSRGWREHHETHMKNWLDAGFAVFKIHSFDSRKINSIVEDQMMVTHAMMISDAFQALNILCTHPLIDSSKIAVTGWSLGGTVALYSAWLPIAEKLSPTGNRFAAHLPFYPAAHMRPEEPRWSNSPILIMHGEIDDYTPLQLVKGLEENLQRTDANIELVVFPEAHHSFDSLEETHWLEKAIRLDHRTVEIDLEGNMSGEIEPGERIPLNEPAQRFAAFQRVQNIGAHAGGQQYAREESQRRSIEFFSRVL